MKVVGLNLYLVVTGILFVMGVLGVILNRRNLISILMSLELILLSVNMNFVIFSIHLKDMVGQIFSMFIITVAAAEAAIALAILVNYFKTRATIQTEELAQLHELEAA